MAVCEHSSQRTPVFSLFYHICRATEPPMAKVRTIFVCQTCGAQSPRWMGRCPECQAWNSYAEETTGGTETVSENARGLGRGESKAVTLNEAALEGPQAVPVTSGINEFDRVLGGGIVPGSFSLVGGDPGIGKSTLM